MRLNKETAEILDFRQETFEQKLKEINDIITGRNTELTAFISDENGSISDERIIQLISELINGLTNYYEQLYGDLSYKPSDKTRELYECFLYCSIQGMALVDVDILQYTMVKKATTFSDIIDMLHHCDTYKDRHALLYIEQLGYPIASSCKGFFNNCDLAYEILTDSNIMTAFTDEENKLVQDMYEKQQSAGSNNSDYYDYENDDNDDYYKQVAKQQLDEKPEPTADELWEQLYGIHDEDEILIPADELEYCEKVKSSQEEWKNSVVAPEKFIAKYLRYRELYFSIDHSRMREDIEKMIDIFLFERGLSTFSLGDKYAMIAYRTERHIELLSAEIRKARCKK